MQPRRTSLLEAAANGMAGLALSFILQLLLFKVLGIAASVHQNLVITASFTALSLARSYALRRLFNRPCYYLRRAQDAELPGIRL